MRAALHVAALAAALVTGAYGSTAHGVCSPDEVVRTYPRPGEPMVSLNVRLVWVYGHLTRANLKRLLAKLPSLVEKGGKGSVSLVLDRRLPWKTTRRRLTFTTLVLRPQTTLKANTIYELSWPKGAPRLPPLEGYRFKTGALAHKSSAGAPVLEAPAFSYNKRGCGHHRAFSFKIKRGDPSGVRQVRLAKKKKHLQGKTAGRLAADFVDLGRPDAQPAGAWTCGGTYSFRLRQRLWGQVRFMAPDGGFGPWSAPFLLVADPKRPGARHTCPPN